MTASKRPTRRSAPLRTAGPPDLADAIAEAADRSAEEILLSVVMGTWLAGPPDVLLNLEERRSVLVCRIRNRHVVGVAAMTVAGRRCRPEPERVTGSTSAGADGAAPAGTFYRAW